MVDITQANSTYQVPFSVPLPANLPSSMFYCGEMMSHFDVHYVLKAEFVGLRSSGHNLPEG